ncbi:hypothetical protein GCM10023238_07260 [Streptomyces heliomycini]
MSVPVVSRSKAAKGPVVQVITRPPLRRGPEPGTPLPDGTSGRARDAWGKGGGASLGGRPLVADAAHGHRVLGDRHARAGRHSRRPTASPAPTSLTAPVTIRVPCGSVPVVSGSKPISGSRCQPMAAPFCVVRSPSGFHLRTHH